MISTPNIVGPGAYLSVNKVETSEEITSPIYSFPKSIREQLRNIDYTLNQTYELNNAIGI